MVKKETIKYNINNDIYIRNKIIIKIIHKV